MGINHHETVDLSKGMETTSRFDFYLASSRCPHPCHLPPTVVLSQPQLHIVITWRA